MSKKNSFFPVSCIGCKNLYHHYATEKKLSGGCMMSYGNHYCTGASRHRKVTSKDMYTRRPQNCPIIEQVPIPESMEEM